MMETEDYEEEYLKDQAFLEAEKKAQMEAELRELEEYENKQLPAKIILKIDIKKTENS